MLSKLNLALSVIALITLVTIETTSVVPAFAGACKPTLTHGALTTRQPTFWGDAAQCAAGVALGDIAFLPAE